MCYYVNKIWIKTLVEVVFERVTGFVKSEGVYCNDLLLRGLSQPS